ncbi:hypothetical protein [Pedobacter sp.]|uniref:hypothetical protein n=1 Tax=Pedobacter sp. TaxID=1411316 RepID=UPI003D7F6630
MNVFDFIVILIVILWGGIGISAVYKKGNQFSSREILFLQGLYTFHMLVSLFFSSYILSNGGDAKAYWFMMPRFSIYNSWESYYRTGTSFILFLTYPLVKYLQLSFYTGGLLFAMVGFQGFIYLYSIIRKFTRKPVLLYGFQLFPYILFLPNLHFWSAGIGKDALSFFAIMLFYYSLFKLNKKWVWALFALFLAYHVRPHIALFLIVSSFVAILIDGKMKFSVKVALGLVMLLGAIFLFNSVVQFMRLDDVSTDSISQYSETKANNLTKGSGSAVALAGYPFPFKVFTFLYRPLFLDVNNSLAIVSSIENLMLLILSVLLLIMKPFSAFKKAPMPIKSILIFFVICTCAFAITLSNLGIMLRQKTPVICCLLIFIFWSFAYRLYLKNKVHY